MAHVLIVCSFCSKERNLGSISTWAMEHTTCSMDYRTFFMDHRKHGTCSMDHRTCSMDHGTRNMLHGTCPMDHGNMFPCPRHICHGPDRAKNGRGRRRRSCARVTNGETNGGGSACGLARKQRMRQRMVTHAVGGLVRGQRMRQGLR